MKKNYLAFILLCLTAVMGISAQTIPTIYGSMVENSSWSGWNRPEGIYSFHPTADLKTTRYLPTVMTWLPRQAVSWSTTYTICFTTEEVHPPLA